MRALLSIFANLFLMVMDRMFRSKIGLGILACILLATVVPAVLLIQVKVWLGLMALLPGIALMSLLYLGTYYTITADKRLLIACGYFAKWSIDIELIYKVRKTRNPISSPALSMDRIEVCYNTGDSVIISPIEKKEFINAFRGCNNKISVEPFPFDRI